MTKFQEKRIKKRRETALKVYELYHNRSTTFREVGEVMGFGGNWAREMYALAKRLNKSIG